MAWAQHQLKLKLRSEKQWKPFFFCSIKSLLTPVSGIYTLAGAHSSPLEFFNKCISRILFFSASCTAVNGYICFVICLPLCLWLVNIKYLLLLYSLTTSALLSPPFFLLFFIPLLTETLFPLCNSVHPALPTSPPSLTSSHALLPNPPPPPLCMLKYSVKDGRRGGSGGERVVRRGGTGGGGGGNTDVRSAAVVMIFCSLFLGTSGPLRATVSSTVFTGSWRERKWSVFDIKLSQQ